MLLLLVLAGKPAAQSDPRVLQSAEQPSTIRFCELAKNPAEFNKRLIRLTAFITHGFENFQLTDPSCPALAYEFSVWVMYGGTAESGTMYCCPGEAGRKSRPKDLTVEGTELPLVRDSVFDQFTALLQKERDTTVHATVVGRFFSGNKQSFGGPTFWGGYGHMGCCSLFVIQRIEEFQAHSRQDVDYTSEAGWYEDPGCQHYERYVTLKNDAREAIEEQRQADAGARSWAYTDPRRVAVESLKPFYKDEVPVLQIAKQTPGRVLFRWTKGKRVVVVVVIRPYWLSFYSKTDAPVWVSATVNEHCH